MNLKNVKHATDQNAVALVNGKNGGHAMVHATLVTEKESSLILVLPTLTVIQHHQKLKLNHVANPKSVNLVHGVNGLNAMPNVINLGKIMS